MKPRIFISIIMLFLVACTNNKPLSDSEKQKITDELKQVTAKIISSAEKADIETILAIGYDSPDNSMLTPEGKSISYKEWAESMRGLFETVQSQKINIIAENYRVIDRKTVLYTNVSSSQMNFKDSSIVMQYPWTMYFLFQKIDDSWRWISGTEYGHEEIIKPAPLPKDISQLELAKKALGRWRSEYGDTIVMYDQQPFGNAQVVSVKTSVKGKPYSENRQLWSFDRDHNRINIMNAGKSGNGYVFSVKFNTSTKYTAVPYINVSNPAYAPYRVEGEFTDPDTYVERVIVNNETVRTVTTTRVK